MSVKQLTRIGISHIEEAILEILFREVQYLMTSGVTPIACYLTQISPVRLLCSLFHLRPGENVRQRPQQPIKLVLRAIRLRFYA